MARPPRWQATLDASVEEACLAVRLYNDSAEARAFEGFVIHMHLAWLYLLHAEFVRDDVDFRYWDPQFKKRLLKIDGEPKRWELERSMRERWPTDSDPVRANLALFIKLRNRLEHRHAHADEALMLNLAGHAHALLVNYETELTEQFGDTQSHSDGSGGRCPRTCAASSPITNQAWTRRSSTTRATNSGCARWSSWHRRTRMPSRCSSRGTRT